jgi:hypothetical protein
MEENVQYLSSTMISRQKLSTFFKKQKMIPPHTQNFTENTYITSYNLSISSVIIVWVVGVTAATSRHVVDLVWM